MTARYLALDLGAESGRALLATYASGRIALRELHRFANEPVKTGETLHWDVLRLWHEMQVGIQAAGVDSLDGIGVDTWGVDYALLGGDGGLLENPYHYRDARTDGVVDKVLGIAPRREIYDATGIQFMQINTLYQMFAASRRTPELLRLARHFFTVPDLLNYWLTGVVACEFTNASTTQMFDPVRREWARPLLEKLGIPTHFLMPVSEPGSVLGELRPELLARFGMRSAPVILPACHDTGSAVAAIALRPKSAFLSSGTWSLMGAETAAPILNETARTLNFTNEGGVCGTTRLLKNIMGMWLLQGCRKSFSMDYSTLVGLASITPSLRSLVNTDHASFLHPASMTDALGSFCRRSGQVVPTAPEDFVQTVLESLAMKYRYTLENLQQVTGVHYEEIRVVGGGARNTILNQLTAEATGLRVVAGPIEATALGNIAVQLLASDQVSTLAEARGVIESSFPTEIFEPRNPGGWDDAYSRFRQYCQIL